MSKNKSKDILTKMKTINLNIANFSIFATSNAF